MVTFWVSGAARNHYGEASGINRISIIDIDHRPSPRGYFCGARRQPGHLPAFSGKSVTRRPDHAVSAPVMLNRTTFKV